MLKNSDTKSAYWCVVSGSEIWTVDGALPFGRGEQWDLPVDVAIKIDHHQGVPVYWVNASDLDRDLELTSLRDLLHLPEPLFLMASKAIQYGHMSQSLRFCHSVGDVITSTIAI